MYYLFENIKMCQSCYLKEDGTERNPTHILKYMYSYIRRDLNISCDSQKFYFQLLYRPLPKNYSFSNILHTVFSSSNVHLKNLNTFMLNV